jgi:hypothetical protein
MGGRLVIRTGVDEGGGRDRCGAVAPFGKPAAKLRVALAGSRYIGLSGPP